MPAAKIDRGHKYPCSLKCQVEHLAVSQIA